MSVGIYNIPEITSALLDLVLEVIKSSRKVAITIKNCSSQTLENPKTFIKSGTCRKGFPFNPVPTGKGVVWGAHKTSYSTYGTSGVIVYHIKNEKWNRSLAFMWKVPFSYVGHSNWWKIKLYEGLEEANEEFYERMRYEDKPLKGDGNPFSGELGGGWSYVGTMGGAGKCTVEVTITDGFS
ncbi:Sea anemone cytolysin [Rhizophagus irregularis]|uniref:Sea anemone cytolysin n=1 Tax=Rhizophagus irregularis TaxID=588596 RepID=A0A2I1HK26_9GLOM|nr:Sea anemone cytolysin [Rhizophagus irregularis]